LSQQLAGALAQHVSQQIFEFPWLAQGYNGIVLHGVSFLREMWLASSPPRYAAPSQIAVTNFDAYLDHLAQPVAVRALLNQMA
jgi:hypothetical protein